MVITLGSDVEVFGINKVGHHVALCGKIGGTKEDPLQLADMPKGFMVQEDNVSLEFNIPVCHSLEDFVNAIGLMSERITSILAAMDLDVSKNASVSFAEEELHHPNALVFGCEPDYNAWTRRENEKPCAEDKCLRTAGGHVHVGIDGVDMLDGIRAMDLFLGVPSVLLDNSPEAKRRRLLYGKAGAMRPKPYGFEYRVLSNFWIFNPLLVEWVYDNTRNAMVYVKQRVQQDVEVFTKEEAKRIQNCISSGDEAEAAAIMEQYNIPSPATISSMSRQKKGATSDSRLAKLPAEGTLMPPINWDNIPVGIFTGNTVIIDDVA
jgi:hypothetical protein